MERPKVRPTWTFLTDHEAPRLDSGPPASRTQLLEYHQPPLWTHRTTPENPTYTPALPQEILQLVRLGFAQGARVPRARTFLTSHLTV